ncbi:MBL fold metallo-hydrolase [Pedobacter gandavensis]|uniref:MBL fold metallo-hydrolase n=1 Tax=Pedobacter gandavensis TaxID=2679963 RepID=A0ABR6EU81_9SPHI|nr:MBL fold metallo-hydrolase [Pedobacter gandavensis]MBB2148834.1 MBL fold metallo-hydrolase [Pedobacter gandavensis]
MKLKVVSSGSVGNSYIVHNEDEALLIECGVRFKDIKQSLNFNLKKVVGCLVSHSHQDHCKGVREVVNAGINVFCLLETANTFGFKSHRIKEVIPMQSFMVGNFKVMAFPLQHDVPCLGFMVEHKDTGRFVFITDTYYCEYSFPGLHNVIIEANYCQTILDAKLAAGATPEFLRNRVLKSHMSLSTCKEFLKANDLTSVNNILLIHLSDSNSHAERFQHEVKEQTAKTVNVASKGLEINFTKTPF